MANITAQEQLMLELLNRARMNPTGEAARYGITLNEGLSAGRISTASKQVLAGNDAIAAAADNHSNWMIATDRFSHDEQSGTSGFTGVDPQDRMEAAGYAFTGSWTYGENIAFRGTTQTITAAMQTQMIMQSHEDLFVDEGVAGRGHRLNILNNAFEEVGIGQKIGGFKSGGTTFNASMVTQDFATSGTKTFVTGVVYNDKVVVDDFFSVGEQVVNATVKSSSTVIDKTGAGGGYELLYTKSGAKTVEFSLSTGKVTVGLNLSSTNVKLDVVNGTEVWANTSITSVSTNVKELHVLGIDKANLNGAASSQKMFGNGNVNVLNGNGGNDLLNGGAGNDVLNGGSGADDLYGGSGKDTFVFKALSDSTALSSGRDTIFDFSGTGGDRIDLSAIDAISGTAANDAFTFIGTALFSGKAGELRYVKQASDTYIHADVNGDKKVDFAIHLDDAVSLAKGYFIL